MSSPDKGKQVPACQALEHDIKNAGIESVFGLRSDNTALLVTTLDAIGVRLAFLRETVAHERHKV